MKKRLHYWIIRNEQIRATASEVIASLPVTEKPLEITVKPFVRDRTLAQNNTYFMWIGQMCNQCGWSKARTHEDMAERYLPMIVENGPNGIKERRTSTTDLSVSEFAAYLLNVEVFASEWGIELTYPADYRWIIGGKAA